MATPVATACAIAAAARAQVLIKSGGVALDRLAALNTLGLDKTGTLTEGSFRVTDVYMVPGERLQERHNLILHYAAALEATSSHPVGMALVPYALGAHSEKGHLSDQSIALGSGYGLPPALGIKVCVGQGIVGTVEQTPVAVGNWGLMKRLGVALPEGVRKDGVLPWDQWMKDAKTIAFVALGGRLELALALCDRPKTDAAATIQVLQDAGVWPALVTGDLPDCASALAQSVGIMEYHAAMQPMQKLEWIQKQQKSRRVVGMVGDGINDGPALVHADVGIAMGAGGTALAAQAADVLLLSDSLSLLPVLLRLARRYRCVVQWNIALAVALKAVMLGLNFVILLPLWTAVVSDMVALVLVIASGLTLLAPLKTSKAVIDRHYDYNKLIES